MEDFYPGDVVFVRPFGERNRPDGAVPEMDHLSGQQYTVKSVHANSGEQWCKFVEVSWNWKAQWCDPVEPSPWRYVNVGDMAYVPEWTEYTRPDWAVEAMDRYGGGYYTIQSIDAERGKVIFYGDGVDEWVWNMDYVQPLVGFDDVEIEPASVEELACFLGI